MQLKTRTELTNETTDDGLVIISHDTVGKKWVFLWRSVQNWICLNPWTPRLYVVCCLCRRKGGYLERRATGEWLWCWGPCGVQWFKMWSKYGSVKSVFECDGSHPEDTEIWEIWSIERFLFCLPEEYASDREPTWSCFHDACIQLFLWEFLLAQKPTTTKQHCILCSRKKCWPGMTLLIAFLHQIQLKSMQ